METRIANSAFEDAAVVRRAVFMDEQGYENEFDQIDESPLCLHPVLYIDGEPAVCARVFPERLEREADPATPTSPTCKFDEVATPDETFILGRVAVLPARRRKGLASKIIAVAEGAARKAGARQIKLHAQEYVIPLYAKAGYEQIAPVDYEDEGQPHAWMAKLL